MNRFASFMALCVLPAFGCSLDFGGSSGPHDQYDNGGEPSPSTRPALECAPREPEWFQVYQLYDDTEHSVHELITCGGLQIRLTQQIMMMVLGSNTQLLKKDERAVVEAYISNPFHQSEDGTWTMEIPDASGSAFSLSFYEPGSGELITADLFDLESYLVGVDADSTMSFSEMQAQPSKKNVFTFKWESEGPLAHFLNDGEPLPDGFELALSLDDLTGGSLFAFGVQPRPPADFGLFNSLLDIEVESLVDYVDERGAIDVAYQVRTVRDSMTHVAASAALAYEVEHLQGNAESMSLDGDTSDLHFVQLGELAGSIEYSLDGEVDGEPVEMAVTSDFGEGEPYPETRWRCE